jgi:hypothetical protein
VIRTLATVLLAPVGVATVVHSVCAKLGMSGRDALAAAFLVWFSCVAMLIIILVAIKESRDRSN